MIREGIEVRSLHGDPHDYVVVGAKGILGYVDVTYRTFPHEERVYTAISRYGRRVGGGVLAYRTTLEGAVDDVVTGPTELYALAVEHDGQPYRVEVVGYEAAAQQFVGFCFLRGIDGSHRYLVAELIHEGDVVGYVHPDGQVLAPSGEVLWDPEDLGPSPS